MIEWLVVALISLLANVLSALAGGGAGLLQLPALLFLGLPFSQAMVTHKVASAFLGLGASARHWRASSLESGLTLLLLAAGLPGVVLGSLLVVQLPEQASELGLGLLTLGLSVYSLLQTDFGQLAAPRHRDVAGLSCGALVVFFIGVVNGALASGTGLFVTVWLVRWFGMDYRAAVAHTLVLVGLAWNGSGAIALLLQASPRWDWLLILIITSLIGGWLGTHLGLLRGNRLIKRSFEVMTFATGTALLWRSLL
jgi:uncharacterized protein